MIIALSNDNQLVIPKEICEAIPIKKGVSFKVIPYNNRIELVPIRQMQQLRGIFQGIDTAIMRDGE